MQKILLFILLTTSLFSNDIIAILDLEQIGLTPQEATILTQRLTTKLVSIGKYQVVERNNMDKILKEQKFQQAGCTDQQCAAEIGKMLNADLMLISTILFNRDEGQMSATFKLVNVESARITTATT